MLQLSPLPVQVPTIHPTTHFIKPHFPPFLHYTLLIASSNPSLHSSFLPFAHCSIIITHLLTHYSFSFSKFPFQKYPSQLSSHHPINPHAKGSLHITLNNKMCSSKAKVTIGIEATATATTTYPVARINGRPVLQPTCNRVPNLEKRNSMKTIPPKSLSPPQLPTKTSLTPPLSPKLKSPRLPATKRGNDSNGLNTSSEKIVIVIPRNPTKTPTLERKKSKSFNEVSASIEASLSYSSSLIIDSPGSIAAVRREQMALQHAERKMKIAHYGRSKSAKFENVVPLDTSSNNLISKTSVEEKRCSFITANSGNLESKIFNTTYSPLYKSAFDMSNN